MHQSVNFLKKCSLVPERINLGLGYGVARSLLALSSFLTILVNDQVTLFPTVKGQDLFINNAGEFLVPTVFEVFGPANFWFAKALALLILGAVVMGYRPRLTGLLHWWVAVSFNSNVFITEGGDQIACVLTTILLPLCLIDPRTWHWQDLSLTGRWSCFFANLTLTALRIQVCIIYAHACIGKFASPEWTNGTALYYWFNNYFIGASEPFLSLMNTLFRSGTLLTAMTWGVLVVEFLLAAAIVAKNELKPLLFGLGLVLHTGIIFGHGILGFVMIMYACLIFYLLPLGRPTTLA